MKKLIAFLSRFLSPAVVLAYFALCIIELAVAESGTGGALLLTMLWAAAMMAFLHYGIYFILWIAQTKVHATEKEMRILCRVVEGMECLLVVFSVVAAVLLYDVAAVAFLLPVALFGLSGAIRFDAKYILK